MLVVVPFPSCPSPSPTLSPPQPSPPHPTLSVLNTEVVGVECCVLCASSDKAPLLYEGGASGSASQQLMWKPEVKKWLSDVSIPVQSRTAMQWHINTSPVQDCNAMTYQYQSSPGLQCNDISIPVQSRTAMQWHINTSPVQDCNAMTYQYQSSPKNCESFIE